MKKFLSGVFSGILLTAGVTSYAEVNSLVGKAIQGEYTVRFDGVPLDKKAIVVDGTSYLPVRTMANVLDLNVDFDPANGISVSKEGLSMVSQLKEFNEIIVSGKKIKSDAFWLIYLDGEQYINVSSVVEIGACKNVSWNNPYLVFEFEENISIKVLLSNNYSKGVDAFSHQGRAMVRLSLFGMKAYEDGNALLIKKDGG